METNATPETDYRPTFPSFQEIFQTNSVLAIPHSTPFFMDVTLRDGNQALRKPWNLREKEIIFQQLLKLNVQGIEVGFASAGGQDFEACSHLSQLAPDRVVISSLSRAVEEEIELSWKAIHKAARPRIHIVYPVSDFTIRNVLRISEEQVKENIMRSVSYARKLAGSRGEVQFSGEHFGDALENIEFTIEAFRSALDAGADVINLPNTVERYRPFLFVAMIRKVVESLPQGSRISVHTHNDLGMATATTVESFFAGATQLETALNGLGERAGNTNTYEVAVALHNCGVKMDLNLQAIYETSRIVARMSGVPVPEKAPLIGEDVVAHRSGIHQDGVSKTQNLKKGAYRAFEADLIGRPEGDRIAFTSQSGKSAIFEILNTAGVRVSKEEAFRLQPALKSRSEKEGGGELSLEQMVEELQRLRSIES
ncbi:2-isopropylmalate synthase [Leptospira fletcheri]|uniref:2-isopropylmalate synthase n=1 Tax=Leptospira fletcheri TaxID=2484981 RepID=A0A4R9G513_9LEPT|nr:2-isopropylmalate synthase LeuA2 [Leptospira fletcheri]TGK06451.1 2-isopropylmalate synthase [Leptospira fletcheri]